MYYKISVGKISDWRVWYLSMNSMWKWKKDDANYQWMEMLYCAAFTTLIIIKSPFLASTVGPGNCPLTVIMFWVLHSLLTDLAWTYFTQIINGMIITNGL